MPPPQPEWLTSRLVICRTRCPHYLADGDRCGIQAAKGRAGELQYMVDNPCPDCTCPAPEPLWTPVAVFRTGGVGFIAVAHMKIGGTEIWHRTLFRNLSNVSGFVCFEHELCEGDLSGLPCPADVGLEAAQRLARSCDVLVVWGIGSRLGDVLEGIPEADRPRVISVTHCDGTSEWSASMMAGQSPWTDHCVHLCPSGVESCPAGIPATMIPNAPDPQRVVPDRSDEETRRELGIPNDALLLLVIARLSPEKRIDRLMDAVAMLPDRYHLVIAGTSGGHSLGHAAELLPKTSHRIKIIDPVESPANLLAAADAYLSASEYEGYGLSVAEAILAGVPVIATPVGLLESSPQLARTVSRDAGAAEWAEAIASDFVDPRGMLERAYPSQAAIREGHSVERFAGAWQELVRSLSITFTDSPTSLPLARPQRQCVAG